MPDIFIEYMVKRQRTLQSTAIKAGAVLAAVILSVGIMMFSNLLGPLSMIAPLIAVAAIYGAYYLITSQNVEYEYSVTNGELDVDQIIAQRKRKRLINVKCKEVEAFGQYKAEQHAGKNYQTKIYACDHIQNPDLWYCVIRLQQSGQTLLVFNANQKMLDGIKPFLPRPIAHEAFRVGR